MIKLPTLCVLIHAPLCLDVHAAWKEREVQACLCKDMETERLLPSGARADCVSATHIIELDKTTEWAEAIGQALHYSEQSGMPAKVILFCKEKRGRNCLADRLRFESTVQAYKLPIALDVYGWADLRDICR